MTRLSDFFYDLPPHLIAQFPSPTRTGSRLLFVDSAKETWQDLQFTDFPNFLRKGDLLILNDTRVIPARLFGQKPSGGKVEILVERVLDEKRMLAQLRTSHAPKINTLIRLENGVNLKVSQRVDHFFELEFLEENKSVEEILEEIGHIPLPPYMKRADTEMDRTRYQTVYARQPGAVAAPTAGLHFDESMLKHIRDLGVELGFVTLHVGAGTFAPVRVEEIHQHVMHAEWLNVSAEVCQQVMETKQRGGRVVAIGTTSVRALESAALDGEIKPFRGETRLFITPGFQFHCVDALLTNFHLPESTLLMLVCAFGGSELILKAYHHAVEKEYRFFSYGDAMFLEKS